MSFLNPLTLAKTAGLITQHSSFQLSDTPNLAGKIAIITGGQAGIGKEITAQLLLHSIAKVYVLARTESKYTVAKAEWAEKHRNSLTPADIERRTQFVQCDLSDVVDVARVANLLLHQFKISRLDMLINNAGQPPLPTYTLSPQGIEQIFATNHIGHFVLTNLLLPLLQQTAAQHPHTSTRILITTSSLHHGCQELDLSLLTSQTRTKTPAALDGCWRYARSKLANILFTRALAERLDAEEAKRPKGGGAVGRVYVNCFFPGNIPTDAMDTWKLLFGGLVGRLVKGTFGVVGQKPEDAAATAVFLAAGADVDAKALQGRYFVPVAAEHGTSSIAQDMRLARTLWDWTDCVVAEALGRDWLGSVRGEEA